VRDLNEIIISGFSDSVHVGPSSIAVRLLSVSACVRGSVTGVRGYVPSQQISARYEGYWDHCRKWVVLYKGSRGET